MTWFFRFLTTLRTSPRRAIVLEVGFILVGGLLLGLALFRSG
jgi:hypothetical protein